VRNLGRVGRLERVKPIFLSAVLWKAVFSLACALKMKSTRGWLLGRPLAKRERTLGRKKPMKVAVLGKV
jgi:hypothetical protein